MEGLSKAQAGVLFVIHHHKDITAKDIADFLGVTRSSVTQIIEPLASRGLIVRQADNMDRRIIHITLTAEGRKTVTRLVKAKMSGLHSALEVLTDKELATLAKLHRKMAGGVQKQRFNS